MIHKRLLFVLFAISLVIAATVTMAADRPHPAGGGVIYPTCTSSLPCIEYDNNSTGPGIRGISAAGNGLAGSTKNHSTSSVNGRAGLIGNDIGTGSFNSGVHGLSVSGTGVSGLSTSGAGVLGQTTTGNGVSGSGLNGVVGTGASFSTAVGVEGNNGNAFGSGGLAGVEGTNNMTSTAIRANGFGGLLFDGNNSHSVDVFMVDDAGNLRLTGVAGIDSLPSIGTSLTIGYSTHPNYGIQAFGSVEGVIGEGNTVGIEGFSDSPSATAVRAIGGGGFVFEGLGAARVDIFTVDDGGNVRAHSFTSDLASTTGQRLVSYAPQASQPVIEDFGEAELTNGSAYVHLESRFASTMAEGGYLVFITPEGDNRGLYVTQKSATGFAVRESQGGHSTVAFSYRIVAKPLGNGSPRLPVEIQRRVAKPISPRASNLSAPAPHVTKYKSFSVVPST